eukprot:scaffold19_cov169-Amphora_coffeaeformis.AAC.9
MMMMVAIKKNKMNQMMFLRQTPLYSRTKRNGSTDKMRMLLSWVYVVGEEGGWLSFSTPKRVELWIGGIDVTSC